MKNNDPWMANPTQPKNLNKSISQVIAGYLAICMAVFAVTVLGVVLLVSYNSPLRLFIISMFIVTLALSTIHWKNGKYRNTWLASIVFIVFLYQLDIWLIKKNHLEFCKQYLEEDCKLNSNGEIDCLHGTFDCDTLLGEDFKL